MYSLKTDLRFARPKIRGYQMYEHKNFFLIYNLILGPSILHLTALFALFDATDQWYTNMDNGLIYWNPVLSQKGF
jgi:hypothetical protein